MMPRRLSKPDFRLFLGKGGSGKSTLARHQIGDAPRVLICDPNGETSWAEGADVIDERADLARAAMTPRWRICWRGMIGAKSPAETREAWDWANRVALAAGDCLIVWDETDILCAGGALPQAAYRIVNAGRHSGVRLYACARRPYRLPRDLSANAARLIVFRSTEPRDLAYLREVIGEEAAARLPHLAPYHALDWTETGTVKEKKSPFR
jgi:hypothetical protein